MTGSHAEPLPELTRTRAAELFTDETGAATAEYAITTMAIVVVLKRPRLCVGGRSLPALA